VSSRLWALATGAMMAAAVVVWLEVLKSQPSCPPLPPPPDGALTFPAVLMTCDSEHVVAMVSGRYGNKVVCASLNRGVQ